MNTEDTDEDATHEVGGGEPIEVGDLLDDPRTDVEALCLCALLWSPTDIAGQVSDLLNGTDFDRVVYGELFEVITAQVQTGAPHDPGSIASRLTQSGWAGGHRSSPAHCRRPRSPGQLRRRWGTTSWPCYPPPTAAAFTWRHSPWPKPPSNCPKINCSSTC